MATLVFDIETVGETWDELDVTTQKLLTRWIDRTVKTDSERKAYYADVKEGLGFSPLTGFIVAIALYDVERKQGAVYYTGKGDELDVRTDEYVLKQRNEKDMLEDFWEGARSYDTFVTFNGRSFDVPFILHRSVAHGIKPTTDLMSGRYLYQQRSVRHVDLLDQLTFYGAMRRRPSLHLFCKAYGIESPKGDGVSGDDVTRLYKEEAYEHIARYCMDDVVATTSLYEKWRSFLDFGQTEVD